MWLNAGIHSIALQTRQVCDRECCVLGKQNVKDITGVVRKLGFNGSLWFWDGNYNGKSGNLGKVNYKV